MTKAWLPTLLAVCGCAAFTWLDANNFWFVFPRLPFAFVLVFVLVPSSSDALRAPRRAIPLLLTALWMLVLPWIPTSQTKRFFLTAESLERGMSKETVRERMEPFLEIGVEYDWPPESAWAYAAAGPEILVFLSSVEGGQVCEVAFDSQGVTRIVADYVD